ncbi:hypothetical protein GCM10011394_25880 [Luteimonas terricola]|uniref:Uncharacterized protein n=1 Tax=Luteimonas terricola TaxID=645597 RepID=A0ABQ2EPX9_9GAMM|nr:hypothetical protein GCM10011394_25880 [Luteimonas terricola]
MTWTRKAMSSSPSTMPAAPDKHDPERIAAQRRRAARMALILGAVALAIYIAFILSGVLAS